MMVRVSHSFCLTVVPVTGGEQAYNGVIRIILCNTWSRPYAVTVNGLDGPGYFFWEFVNRPPSSRNWTVPSRPPLVPVESPKHSKSTSFFVSQLYKANWRNPIRWHTLCPCPDLRESQAGYVLPCIIGSFCLVRCFPVCSC